MEQAEKASPPRTVAVGGLRHVHLGDTQFSPQTDLNNQDGWSRAMWWLCLATGCSCHDINTRVGPALARMLQSGSGVNESQ